MNETTHTVWIVGMLIIANVYIAVSNVLLALKNYYLYGISFFGALLYFLFVFLLIKFNQTGGKNATQN
jgi:hypothetical protein